MKLRPSVYQRSLLGACKDSWQEGGTHRKWTRGRSMGRIQINKEKRRPAMLVVSKTCPGGYSMRGPSASFTLLQRAGRSMGVEESVKSQGALMSSQMLRNRSGCVAWASLKLVILLPQLPEFWQHKHTMSNPKGISGHPHRPLNASRSTGAQGLASVYAEAGAESKCAGEPA